MGHYNRYKKLLQVTKGVSVRDGENDRLYLIWDATGELIAEAIYASKVKDVRKWAIKKMATRYEKALKHRDYHQKEVDKLNMEAGKLATYLNYINDND
jgi:hypothetical protein